MKKIISSRTGRTSNFEATGNYHLSVLYPPESKLGDATMVNLITQKFNETLKNTPCQFDRLVFVMPPAKDSSGNPDWSKFSEWAQVFEVTLGQ